MKGRLRLLRSFARPLGVRRLHSPAQWLLRLLLPARRRPAHALGRLGDRLIAALARLAASTPAASAHPGGRRRFLPARTTGTWPARRRRLSQWWWRLVGHVPQPDYLAMGEWLESAPDAPWLASGWLKVALGIALAMGFWLTVTTPMDADAQLVFALALGAIAIVVRNTPGLMPTLILIGLSVLASCRYGWWRLTQSMDLEPGWETVLGYGLLAAELYAWLIMMLGFAQCAWPLRRPPVPLPADPATLPHVDVFIPTYNEPLAVVGPTVLAAKGMDWPADRMTIHVLDDGRREAVREFAAQAGVSYLTRPDNRGAKAGNLNHALACTSAPFIAVFDCDHLPVRSFLQTTMGWMVRDTHCALVQTPHHFFSPDPFERNLDTFQRIPNEGSLFYGLVQGGNDFWNATFFCGSCAVLRRSALATVGGIAEDTVTEDAHTALRLHRGGWRTAYINITQAAGLATESLSQHVAQRVRWARGMAQIFRIDNPFLGRGLSLMQRLCYGNAMLHFFYGLPRLVFLTAPLAYLFFELHIIRSASSLFALYLLPHLILPQVTTARMQGAYRHSFWAEVYETVLAWYITLPTLFAFVRPNSGGFNVTSKGGQVARTHLDWNVSRPYLALVMINLSGFGVGLVRLFSWNRFEAGTVVLNMTWTALNLLILGAAIGVAHERRQIRDFHRVNSRLPVVLYLPDGHTIRCHTENYSLAGLGLALPESAVLEPGTPLSVGLQSEQGERVFPARVTARRERHAGLQFAGLDIPDQEALIACTFGRSDAWSRWHEQFAPDLPLRGLQEIIALGLRGYGDLLGSAARSLRRRLQVWRASLARN